MPNDNPFDVEIKQNHSKTETNPFDIDIIADAKKKYSTYPGGFTNSASPIANGTKPVPSANLLNTDKIIPFSTGVKTEVNLPEILLPKNQATAGHFADANKIKKLEETEKLKNESKSGNITEDEANMYYKGATFPKSQYVKAPDNNIIEKKSTSWGNLGQDLMTSLSGEATETASGAVKILKDLSVNLNDALGTGDSNSPNWLESKGGQLVTSLNKANQWTQANSEANALPNTTAGHVVHEIGKALPMIATLTATGGESIAAKLAAKGITPTADAVINAASNPLTKYLTITGGLKEYSKDDATLKSALGGAVEGFVSGMTLAAQMGLAGRLTENQIANLAINNKLTQAVVQANNVGKVFAGTSIVENILNGQDIDLDKATEQYITGLAFELPHVVGSIGEKTEHQKIDGKVLQTIGTDNAIHNFLNADPEIINQANDAKGTHEDYQLKSLNNGVNAGNEDNLADKQAEHVAQITNQKISDIKFVTEKILEDKEGFLKKLDETNYTPEQKETITQKVEQVYAENQPQEVAKRRINNEIKDLQSKKIELENTETAEPIDSIKKDIELKHIDEDIALKTKALTDLVTPKTDSETLSHEKKIKRIVDKIVNNKGEAKWSDEEIQFSQNHKEEIESELQKINKKNIDTLLEAKSKELDNKTEPEKQKPNIEVKNIEDRFVKLTISGNRSISDLQKESNGNIKFIDLGNDLVAWKLPKESNTTIQQYFIADVNSKSNIVTQVILNSKGEFSRLNESNIKDDAKSFGENYDLKLARLNEAKNRLSAKEISSNGDKTDNGDSEKDMFYTGRSKKYEDLKQTKGDFLFFSKNPKISEWHGGEEGNVTAAKLDTSEFLDLTDQAKKVQFVKDNFTDEDIDKLYPDLKSRAFDDRDVRKSFDQKHKELIDKYRDRLQNDRFSSDGKIQQFLLKKIKDKGYRGVKLLDFHFGEADVSYVVLDKNIINQGKITDSPEPTEKAIDLHESEREGLSKHLEESDKKQKIDDLKEKLSTSKLESVKKETQAQIDELEGNPRLTGIRNSVVDSEREARGLSPANSVARKELGTTWDEAMKIIEDNPNAENDLIEELKNKPRALSDKENALLLHKQIAVQNEYEKVNDAINEAADKGDEAAIQENKIKLARISDELLDIYNIGKMVGTENARGLNSRKLLANEDYSLGSMIAQKRAANKGQKLSSEVEKEIADLHKKIKDTQKAFDEYVAKKEAEKFVAETQSQIRKRKRSVTKENLEEERKAIIQNIKSRISESRKNLSSNPIPIEFFADIAQLARVYIEKGVVNVAELVDKIHEDLKDSFDDLEKRHVRDAISNYGQTKKLSQEPPDVILRDLKAQARLMSALEDAESGVAPLKTGLQRDKPTDKQRELQKKVVQAMKENNIQTTSPEQQLKSSLDAIKTRLKNSIADLEKQLETGEKTPKKIGVKYDDEATVLKEKRDELKSQLEAIEGKQGMSDEQRLQSYKTRLSNLTKEYEKKLASGDFSKKQKKEYALDSEALKLKAENERVKDKFKIGLEKDRLKGRSLDQKVQDTFVKWQRGFKLSGLTTLAKLTSAALLRQVITPIEELVGAGISKAIPGIASKAQREGNASLKIEAKALTEGFTKGLDDAWKTLNMGKSDIETVFGKGGKLPPEAIDFFGHLHSALKAVPKRNEFTRSFEKRMLSQMKNGIDVTDPMVQSKTAIEAYKDANRAIFMQDNKVATGWTMFTNYLETADKKTGATPTKPLATALKWLVPFVKVPTNIIGETVTYGTGSITGAYKLGKAMYKGIENVSPEEADIILRHLKKGSLGASLLLLGYFNPQNVGGYYNGKRDDKDVEAGGLRLYGVDIPKFLVHNPLLETLQIGATVRRVSDKYMLENGLSSGIAAGLTGLSEEIPFVQTGGQINDALHSEKKADYFIGELAKNTVDPALLQEIARWTDRENGKGVKRNPKTIWEHIETGVPGLRGKVDEKKEGKHPMTREQAKETKDLYNNYKESHPNMTGKDKKELLKQAKEISKK